MPEAQRLQAQGGNNQVALAGLQSTMDACTAKCIAESLGHLPGLQQRLEGSLAKMAR